MRVPLDKERGSMRSSSPSTARTLRMFSSFAPPRPASICEIVVPKARALAELGLTKAAAFARVADRVAELLGSTGEVSHDRAIRFSE